MGKQINNKATKFMEAMHFVKVELEVLTNLTRFPKIPRVRKNQIHENEIMKKIFRFTNCHSYIFTKPFTDSNYFFSFHKTWV